MRKIAFTVLLSISLAAEPSAITVLASGQMDYATFEDFRSGSTLDSQGISRADYITIEISSESDLYQLAEDCRVDSWSKGKYVVLTTDVMLQDNSNLSIPTFSGIFDGAGHRITNLHLLENGSVQGLFRYLEQGGEIRNLSVEGRVAPDGSKSQVGGIVGINYGLIYNCIFSGTVEGDNEVGGIAGVNASTGEIRKSISHANIIGNHSSGGIAGINHGILNNCSNTGEINTHSTEVTYELGDITMESFEDMNATSNISAHTDSGGIAGLSDGKIYYCTNSGTIGYTHVGYNTGGIVGRLSQGYLQNCTNTGHVLGRKDVGGIAGQMEPFLEIQYLNDRLSELDKEMDYTIDLLDQLHNDVRGYGTQASSLAKNVTTNLRNVSSAAGSLTSTTNDLWYIYNQELNGVSNDIKTLNNDLKNAQDTNPGNNQNNSVSSGDIKDTIEQVKDKIEDVDNQDPKDINDILDDIKNRDTTEEETETGNNKEEQNTNSTENGSNSTNEKEPNWEINLPDNTEAYKAAMEKFGTNTGKHLDTITTATSERSEGISDHLNVLDKELQAAMEHLGLLAEVLEAGGETAGNDMDALVEQARVLRRLMSDIRDDLFSYEGITVKDTSDEAASRELSDLGAGDSGQNESAFGTETSQEEDSDVNKEQAYEKDIIKTLEEEEKQYDTSSFQKGKIKLCLNQGLIEADTNVGGIVGQIATELDFDPEDDITLTGTESFDIEQTIKAVVRESRNMGDVIGKKDCIGGIIGKADFGAVISCESYGDISSTSGSNVGGIAGTSSYAIRSCYSMGKLEGVNNIGGIAGKGSDIFYSYAMNDIIKSGENSGAIAGKIVDKGTLYGNYYVNETEGGVDSIGYQGGAAPLSYEQFSQLENIPEAFTVFTIVFQVEGKELASYTCHYGEGLMQEQIPEIPAKEGCYAVWPEYDLNHITGNKILEAQYEKWNHSIASNETNGSGKSILLVEGNFLPEALLSMEQNQDEIAFTITCNAQKEDSHPAGMPTQYTDEVKVRVLCEKDPEKAIVEIKNSNGNYQTAETKVMGSYLVFTMQGPGTFRLQHGETQDYGGILILVGAGVTVLLVWILIRKGIAKKRRTNRTKQD